eukprot:TRINITY_DN8512_c0_g1_i1.p1 TRINITY_DN8512_c0_g1~~TRINITY_DN8512_c0_g1_i1.p1  ORF type:complete len:618 (+),score=69.92 TRINITY_DN8512_c0_g1_i1:790-2643(+)
MDFPKCSHCHAPHPGGFACVFCHRFYTTLEVSGTSDPLVTVEPPVPHQCCVCKEMLHQSFVVALEATWHPGCFVCQACGHCIQEEFFACDEKRRPYHAFCICATDPSRRCHGCSEDFSDWVLFAVGQLWHPRCLKCSVCGLTISAYGSQVAPDGTSGVVHVACLPELEPREADPVTPSLELSNITPPIEPSNVLLLRGKSKVNRRRLNELVRSGIDPSAAAEWAQQDVARWLRAVGLGKYEFFFTLNQINGVALLRLTMGEMKEFLKIDALEERQRLAEMIDELRLEGLKPADGKEFALGSAKSMLDETAEHAAAVMTPLYPSVFLLRHSSDVTHHRRVLRMPPETWGGSADLPAAFEPTNTALHYYRNASRPVFPQTRKQSLETSVVLPLSQGPSTPCQRKSPADLLLSTAEGSRARKFREVVHGLGRLVVTPDPNVSQSALKAWRTVFTDAPLQPLPFKGDPGSYRCRPATQFIRANEYFSTACPANETAHFTSTLRTIEAEREARRARIISDLVAAGANSQAASPVASPTVSPTKARRSSSSSKIPSRALQRPLKLTHFNSGTASVSELAPPLAQSVLEQPQYQYRAGLDFSVNYSQATKRQHDLLTYQATLYQ